MKILIIRNYPSFMDVENNTYNIQEIGLAKAFIRKGNICDIIFWTDKEEKVVTIPVDECGEIKVYYKNGKTALKNTVYTGIDDLIKQYDIIQPCEYNQIQSWILAKKYPKKVFIYHGPYYCEFNKKYNLMCKLFDMFFLKTYIKNNTKFVVKSELAKQFLTNKGIKDININVAGVGIDTQLLSSNDIECNEYLYQKMSQDSNNKILYIGRFEERRNIKFIFDVFKEVISKNSNVSMYMIGTGDKEYINEMWDYADKLGIRNNIIYQEKMAQKYLSKIYAMTDFFLLPTHYEIFGMVLLESMYYKTVVLTTLNGGSSTLIKNGKNGLIINKFDKNVWAERILNLCDNKDKMKKIEENAHITIKEGYTWDSVVKHFIEFYR